MSHSPTASSNDSSTRSSHQTCTKPHASLRNREAFIRDDGTPLNYTLVNIKDWCKNTFEVVNQLRINTDNSHHRYDVMLLINGVPVVQIELKTLGISPRRAMEQIVDYKNDPGNGYTKTLLCFVQLFIVSNRTDTWYFANNNARHFAFDADERFLPIYQFAAEDNTKITHLDDFADRFLAKCTLGQMISKYMVLIASEQKLLMMRPYQIYAVKAIVDCIDQNCGNGYIWHTTGSGKTLTSFKASTLLKTNESIHKCLFVVDRKDLDRQTREEFNRFQENCVEENTNTAALVRRLLSDDYADKVIVTTIQKLGLALDENSKHNKQNIAQGRSTFKQRLEQLRDKRMVFIFDECHRSQFGENHKAIKEFFPNSQLFGFTGTPIFEDNATVKQIEGDVATLRPPRTSSRRSSTPTPSPTRSRIGTSSASTLTTTSQRTPPPSSPARLSPSRRSPRPSSTSTMPPPEADASTRCWPPPRSTTPSSTTRSSRSSRPNARPPTPSSSRSRSPPSSRRPRRATRTSSRSRRTSPRRRRTTGTTPRARRPRSKAIIADYNQQYGTNHDINNFDLYYQDIQQRIKDQQFPNRDLPRKGEEKIDITIVVDMLLTGFDAKYLNTLYVDKNLKHHGLIQAFSRTNRVLNATKPYGHILDFRQQQDSVDAAIALFSGAQADRAREIWLVEKAPVVIDNFKQAVADLGEFMQSQGLEAKPDQVNNLMGDDARAQFIKRFKEVQRLQTQLDQYTDLTDEQREQIEQALPKDDLRAFRGVYLETAQRLKEQQGTLR